MPLLVWIVLISIAFSMKFSKDNYYKKISTASTICHTCRERDVGFKIYTSRWSLSFVSCIMTQSNRSLWPFVPSLTPPKDEAIYGSCHTPWQYIYYIWSHEHTHVHNKTCYFKFHTILSSCIDASYAYILGSRSFVYHAPNMHSNGKPR